MILIAGAARAQGPDAGKVTGSICLAPVNDDAGPRGNVSERFGVRVDNGLWISVPPDTPQPIPGLVLEGKHLVSIRDGEKVIESFWFRFDQFHYRDLCLWYKPWYRTWSLWDAADGGRKCQCQTAKD